MRLKRLIHLALLLFLGFIISVSSILADDNDDKQDIIDKVYEEYGLIKCKDEVLNFQIPCGKDWSADMQSKSVKFNVVDTDSEKVTISISLWDESGLNFEDLTPSALQRVFNYSNSFKFDRVWFDPYQMVSVEGELLDNPDEYLLDYFSLRENLLYRISFSVYPKEKKLKYVDLFSVLISKFIFLY